MTMPTMTDGQKLEFKEQVQLFHEKILETMDGMDWELDDGADEALMMGGNRMMATVFSANLLAAVLVMARAGCPGEAILSLIMDSMAQVQEADRAKRIPR